MTITLLAIWTLQVFLFGTALTAIRLVSRTRLADAAARFGRPAVVEQFDRHERAYAVTALLYRQLGMVFFVVTLFAATSDSANAFVKPLKVILISMAWLLISAIAMPSACARYLGESYLALTLPVLDLIRRGSRPFLWVVDVCDEIVRRLAGAPKEAEDPAGQMEREILDAVTQAETSGAVDEAEKQMIRSVMVLDQTTVGEVMTPRTDIIAVEVNESWPEIRRVVTEEGHSRIPVYEGTLDHIIGVLYARDLLGVTEPARFSVRTIMRGVQFIPETKDLNSLLREFQAARVHIAVVLDEYGGTSGLVTIEDILEELVGDIDDEHDDAATPLVKRINDHVAEFDARVRLDEANEELSLALPLDEAYDTLGGFVFSRLGRVPTAGEHLVEGSVRIDVLDADRRKVKRVRLSILEANPV